MEHESLSPERINKISGLSNHRLRDFRGFLKNKRELVPVVLLAIAMLSGILTVVKVTGLFITSARAERIVRKAAAWSKPDRNILDNEETRSKLIAEDLKQDNLFWPEPKGHPVKAVLGIFGDEAYIDGRWYKVGAKIKDAKIIAIDADSVTTEWHGKQQIFRPIDAGEPPATGSPGSRPDIPVPRPGNR
jgi:hypothetical protein